MRRASFLMAVCGAFLVATNLQAGIIVNPPNLQNYQINAFERIGNTFIAEDASVKAALYLDVINPSFPTTDPIRFQLFNGSGTGGALLYSQAFVVPGGFSGFFDVDLTSIALTVGNTYSFTAMIDGTSPYWAVRGTTVNAAYGKAIFNNAVDQNQRLALRVTPVGEVPEPGSLTLIGLGAIGLAGAARRRRQAV